MRLESIVLLTSGRIYACLFSIALIAAILVAPESASASCGSITLNQSQNVESIGMQPTRNMVADSDRFIARDRGNPLAPSTLSRLAALSGPFQSFRDSQIAKDPNCDRWGGRDKVRHAAIFFTSTLGIQLFLESTTSLSKTEAFLISAAIGTLTGLGKEYYDKEISDKDCFSEQDLLANTAGILSAGLVIMIAS